MYELWTLLQQEVDSIAETLIKSNRKRGEAAQCCVETITLSGSVLLDKATKNMNLIFSLSAFHSVYLQLLSFFSILVKLFITFTPFSATNTDQTFWHWFVISPHRDITHWHNVQRDKEGDTKHLNKNTTSARQQP